MQSVVANGAILDITQALKVSLHEAENKIVINIVCSMGDVKTYELTIQRAKVTNTGGTPTNTNNGATSKNVTATQATQTSTSKSTTGYSQLGAVSVLGWRSVLSGLWMKRKDRRNHE